MATLMTRIYSNLAGCDFTNDPAKVALNRSPNCVNMYKDYTDTQGNCVQTRQGLALVFQYINPDETLDLIKINGMCRYEKDGNTIILVHAKNYLFFWEYPSESGYEQNQNLITKNMNDARSSFAIFNNKVYINDGKNYLVYDGTTLTDVSEDAFVPTTTISRRPDGGGVIYQAVNVLTSRRKNSFCADGESTDYYLDTTLLDEDGEVKVYINDILQETTTYSVNKVTGCITFTEAPEKPLTEGQDNVVIEFSKAGTDYATRIPNCAKNIVFDNRIFFTGNPQYKNAIFHCELNDPAYISDLAYYQDGISDSAIKSFTVGNNLLWVFKEPSQQRDTIFYHTPTIDSESGKIYPSAQGNISLGCVSECVNFNDDIVFVSPLGLEGITGNITDEQLVSHRSSLIDTKFINENNFENLQMCEWRGYLICLVNGHMYLADSRQIYSGVKGYEYEWYYWNFSDKFVATYGNICSMISFDEELIVGTEKGYILKFDSSVNYDGNRHSEDMKIYSCWQTPDDIFGDTNNLKTTNKRGGIAKIKTIPNGKITVSVQTNKKPEKVIKEYSATGFDFNNIDFENFAFTTKDMSYIVYKIKMKKFIDLSLKFYSNESPFGLYDVTIEVFTGSYVKRT